MIRSLLLLAGIAAAAVPAAGALAGTRECRGPSELTEDAPELPVLAERFRTKQPVTIVAIGGASTAGNATENAARDAYPKRLQDSLERRHPEVPITVLNKGVARQTTAEMVERFPRDVFALSPALVIWETGTFDAARSVDVDVFATALAAGLAELRQHKLDIMLINMQYSRSTASVINFEPYLDAMQQTADVEDVYVFRRFETMRYWSETGVFNFLDVPKDKRAPFAAEVYECLADRLADAIDRAMR